MEYLCPSVSPIVGPSAHGSSSRAYLGPIGLALFRRPHLFTDKVFGENGEL